MLPVILAEIDEIILLVEAQIPANPQSPSNKILASRLRRDMAKYFRSLEDAFPYSELASIYNRYVEKE